MRRRHRGTDAQMFLKEGLMQRMHTMMANRRILLAPFPMDPLDLYWMAWTPEERQALDILSKYEHTFRTSSVMHLTNVPVPEGVCDIGIKLPMELPLKSNFNTIRVAWGSVPEDATSKIKEWISLWYQLNKEQSELAQKIGRVADACKTYGQVYRLWPDIISLFGEEGKRKIEAAAAVSRLPHTVGYWDGSEGQRKFVLYEEYKPESFAPFTSMIAECLLLPETTEKEIVSLYGYRDTPSHSV